MNLRTIFITGLVCVVSSFAAPDFSLSGFAAYDGAAGQLLAGGTTGGAGGTEVTVTTAADLIKYMAASEPYIIYVSGQITMPADPAMYEVKSNKSIIGVGDDPAILVSGLNIGPMLVDDAVLTPPVGATNNVIIRNIRFADGGDDLINVQMYSHHVWIDHCDFSNSHDGCVDIKRGSDWVTVSWNKFSNHKKTSLVGHDDANGAQDKGHLHVTYHHNWFHATEMRHPRVRFGWVHVYNNYYDSIGDYGIGVAIGAQVYSEHNSFLDFEDCAQYFNTADSGWIKDIGSLQVGTETFPTNPVGVMWEPLQFYTYSVDSAALVKDLVPQYCGVGKLGITAIKNTSGRKLPVTTVQHNTGSGLYTIHGKKLADQSTMTNASQVIIYRNHLQENKAEVFAK